MNDSPDKSRTPRNPSSRTSPKRKFAPKKGSYNTYSNIDLVPFFKQIEADPIKPNISAVSRVCKIKRRQLSVLYHRWIDAGRPEMFIQKENRGRKKPFTNEEEQDMYDIIAQKIKEGAIVHDKHVISYARTLFNQKAEANARFRVRR